VGVVGQGELEITTNVGRATPPTWSALALFDGTEDLSGVSCAQSGVCAAIDGAGNVVAGATGASGDPVWGAAQRVDPGHALTGVSCTVSGLCVAVDDAGRALVSTDAGDATPTWSAPFAVDDEALTGVSCASEALCVAVDGAGDAVASTSPSSPGAASWGPPSPIDGTAPLTGVSCPTSGLCVAVDAAGGAVISTTAGSTWSSPTAIDSSGLLTAVSCTASGLCVAVDQSGQAVTSTNASAATPTWSATPLTIDKGDILSSVSCTNDGFCLAGDTAGKAVYSESAGASSPVWTASAALTPGAVNGPVSGTSCVASGLCVLVEGLDGRAIVGHRPAAAVSISGASGAFPDTAVGSSVATTFTITNSGGAALNVAAAAIGGADASEFAVRQDLCSGQALKPAATCNVAVSFTPTGPETYSATLEITSDAASSPDGVALSGTGTQPALTVAPQSGSFPETPVGAMSTAQPFEVTNPGNGTLSISGATLTGADAAQFALTGDSCGAGLAPSKHCFVDVAFAPTSAGPHSAAALEIASDAPAGPQSVALSGTGGVPLLAVPPAVAFGATPVGATSAAQLVTVTNSGTATLQIASVGLAGADAGQFTATDEGCGGAALAPGATCTVSVAFAPTSAGAHTDASLTITSDAASSPDAVALSGTGVAAPSPQPAPQAPPAAQQPAPQPVASPQTPTIPSNAFKLVSARGGRGGTIVVTLKLPAAGELVVRTTTKVPTAAAKKPASAKRAARVSPTIVYGATASHRSGAPATVSVTIHPAKVAAAALKRDHKLRVAIAIAFTPTGGKVRSQTVGLTVDEA
jgi:hypothetical protein